MDDLKIREIFQRLLPEENLKKVGLLRYASLLMIVVQGDEQWIYYCQCRIVMYFRLVY